MTTETKNPVGRPHKFKTPEELQAKAEEYFRHCDTHPVEVWKRKGAGVNQSAEKGSAAKSDEGTMYIARPYTIDGLALWCGIGNWHQWRSDQSEEFRKVISALEARVRDQQVTGAMVGMYNPNLTARLNGIADKTDLNINAEQQQSATQALDTLLGRNG